MQMSIARIPGAFNWRILAAINWRIVAAALFGVAILHIVATLAAPGLAIATAFDRLELVLTKNRMVIMPEVAPGSQPLPFMSPALRYAMCRFDTSAHPVEIVADLLDAGASLTVYSPRGETIYASAASSELTRQRIRIVPPDERFLGLTPEARGVVAKEVPSATLSAFSGVAIIAVPERGYAYRAEMAKALDGARCGELTATR
jgi:hypothetical protein